MAALRRAARVIACAVLALGIVSPRVAAQGPASGEAAVKSAFLVGFMKFVRWPPEVTASTTLPLTVGIMGDPAVLEALSSRPPTTIQGRPLRVRSVAELRDVPLCQVLFVGKEATVDEHVLAAVLSDASVFTVSDRPEDAVSVVISFVSVNNQLAFDVNLAAMRRARITLDSQLLGVARRVSTGLPTAR